MHAIPAPKAVKDLFEDLLGRGVEVADANPFLAENLPMTVVAIYVDDSKKLAAVAGLDLVLAANVGAAIGLIPPGGAEACVEDKELSPMIAENVGEVCNVLVTLLNHENAPHLKLHQVILPGEQIPGDAAGRLIALGNRLDLAVSVAGYGTGRFGLALAG